jgi:hypothetical protein
LIQDLHDIRLGPIDLGDEAPPHSALPRSLSNGTILLRHDLTYLTTTKLYELCKYKESPLGVAH